MIKESMMTDIDYSGESEIVMNKVDNKPKNFIFSLFFLHLSYYNGQMFI